MKCSIRRACRPTLAEVVSRRPGACAGTGAPSLKQKFDQQSGEAQEDANADHILEGRFEGTRGQRGVEAQGLRDEP